MRVIDQLAMNSTSAVGQAALVRHPDCHRSLLDNTHMHDDTWTTLWHASGRNNRIGLLNHHLNDARIETVLATPRLPRVLLSYLISHHQLSLTTARRVLADARQDTTRSPARFASEWLNGGQYHAELEDELLDLVTEREAAEMQLSSPHLFDQDRMLELLAAARRGPLATAFAADLLLGNPNAGPDVIAVAVATPGTSVKERDTLYNYAVTRPWDQADTDRELALLAQYGEPRLPHTVRAKVRAMQSAAGYTPLGGRAEHDAWLAEPANQPGRHVVNFRDLDREAGSNLDRQAARHLEHLLETAGPAAWEIAVTLLTEKYHGNVIDLAATADALAKQPAHQVAHQDLTAAAEATAANPEADSPQPTTPVARRRMPPPQRQAAGPGAGLDATL
jgi:hypothetical protein